MTSEQWIDNLVNQLVELLPPTDLAEGQYKVRVFNRTFHNFNEPSAIECMMDWKEHLADLMRTAYARGRTDEVQAHAGSQKELRPRK